VAYLEQGSSDADSQRIISQWKSNPYYSSLRERVVSECSQPEIKRLFEIACKSNNQKLADTILQKHKFKKAEYQELAKTGDVANNIKFAKKAYYKSLGPLQGIWAKHFERSAKTTEKVQALSPTNVFNALIDGKNDLFKRLLSSNTEFIKDKNFMYKFVILSVLDNNTEIEKFLNEKILSNQKRYSEVPIFPQPLKDIINSIPLNERSEINNIKYRSALLDLSLSKREGKGIYAGSQTDVKLDDLRNKILTNLSFKIQEVPERNRLAVLKLVLDKVADKDITDLEGCLQTLQNNEDPKNLLDELKPFF
jgi:hypothetical protein